MPKGERERGCGAGIEVGGEREMERRKKSGPGRYWVEYFPSLLLFATGIFEMNCVSYILKTGRGIRGEEGGG